MIHALLGVLSTETWILLATSALILRFYIYKRWQLFKDLKIPHNPPSILNLGNIRDFIKDPDSLFNQELERKKKFGYVYGSYIGLSPRIVISDPELLKQIQIKEFVSFGDRQRSFSRVNGKEMNVGVNMASGSRWKRIRTTLSPAFSSSKLKNMSCIIDQCTDRMVSNLKEIADGNDGRFLAKQIFDKLSLDSICSAAFGVNVHTQDTEGANVVRTARKLFDISLTSNFLLMIFFMFPWTEKIGEFFNYSIFPRASISYFSLLTDALIRSKAAEQQRVDLMRLMLSNEISEKEAKNGASKGLTRNEIVGNSMLMILAGFETTANAMLFLAYNLAVHKEVQEKLRKEICEVMEEHDTLSYEALWKMSYLTQCINETLRLYPALPRTSRYCEKEVTINGMRIPQGVHVDIPIFGMGRDEEYWEKPLEFKPERMDDMSQINPVVLQPFGVGPRSCVGMRFALMEIKMSLCKILLQFELDVCEDTPKPPVPLTFKVSLQAKEDVYLRIRARQDKIGN